MQSEILRTRLRQVTKLEDSLRKVQTGTYENERRRLADSSDILEFLAFHRSLIGDYSGAIHAFSTARPARNEDNFDIGRTMSMVEDAAIFNAVEYIGERARDKQIVILNEAHHVPLHRAFAMQLATKLRSMGFTYLACETFASNVYFPFQHGDVELYDGYYTQEPMFANFIRNAIEERWTFVAYERERTTPQQKGEQEKAREFVQATNIVSRVFKNDPKAKILIYVGYGHAAKFPESSNDSDESMFAAQLKRLTGIDPYTIDQATLYDQHRSKWQSATYRALHTKLKPATASVLTDGNGQPIHIGIDSRAYDVQVIHPPYKVSAKTMREEWMEQLPQLRYYEIPTDIYDKSRRSVVYAFSMNSSKESVPLDTVMIDPDRPAPMMFLKSNDVRFVVERLDD